MTKNQTLMAALAEPFPVEMEKTLVKSGVSLVYLPVSEVINRLNKVLGPESWSFTVISIERDQYDNDEIIAHINLSIDFGDGKIVNKHGIGGQSVKRAKSTGKPITLLKTSVSYSEILSSRPVKSHCIFTGILTN